MKKSKSILFVCMGNICRSPLAEAIMRHKLLKAGIKGVKLDSAGTIDHHAGEPPHHHSVSIAKENGVPIRHKSRPVNEEDFIMFEIIFVMDHHNHRDLEAEFDDFIQDDQVHKVTKYLNGKGKNSNVPDPYYGTRKDYEKIYSLLDTACEAILKELYL